MNEPKVTDLDYINFLLAAPKVVSSTEAARVQPESEHKAAHDAFTRLLQRFEPDSEPLWQEAQAHVDRHDGILVLDDSTLDKPYAQYIPLVHRHWSGKHHRVVSGINLLTLLWSDGTDAIPCDYRLYDAPHDGLTKNDHFQAMLTVAKARGFHPRYVVFDSWYSSLPNLKAIRDHGWLFVTQLKSNRQVNPDGSGNRAIEDCKIANGGTRVHLKGFGFILLFRLDTPDGDTQYWATNDLFVTMDERRELARQAWAIETYHRALKQFCGVERCAARSARAQRNHIGWGIRAFLRLEYHRITSGTSWFETKLSIIRPAIQAFLASPIALLVGFEQVSMAHKPPTA